ncbi:hypothetical protein [Streptococcus pantholopis]|uniref:Uncharacterized protein n=2 Tax=Streptococcus TaxID=1301 RepID=A0A172Q744_9STRE|nr:hypothetical protein [Streptococcus pantholopis]AND79261.1 hypothetical protein A0O21_04075 [Streptococcus pantholopis]
MALTDQNLQELQNGLKDNLEKERLSSGDTFITKDKKTYQVVNSVNDTTQALAVAPVYSDGQVDYSQTAIVVAGTQPGLNESTKNAVEASGVFGLTDGQLTAQTEAIDQFYQETVKKLEVHKGTVSNMSGFSQSGPGVAKVGAKYQVPKITNFTDWAAAQAVKSGAFSNSELAYLKDHATVYSDSGKDLTYLDGGKGEIPYGKVVVVEGTQGLNDPIGDHDPKFFHIKGDKLDIDYYVKKGQFVSGMTKEQVIKVARKKAKEAAKNWDIKDPSTWFNSTDYRLYLLRYVMTYGDFAVEPTKAELLTSYKKTVKDLRSQLKTATGSKRISLREELLRAVAEKARLQAELKVQEIKDEIAQAKEALQADITATRQAMYQIAEELTDSEVAELLSPYTMENLWDSQAEAQNLAEADAYQNRMMAFADKLEAAADNLIATDQEGAALFSTNKK